MRLVAIMAAAFLAASCGPSQAELDEQAAKKEEARQQRERAIALQECEAEQDRLEDANNDAMRQNQNMVKTTLDDIGRSASEGDIVGAYGWSIEIEKFDSTEWRWVEEEAAAVANDYGESRGLSDRIHYTVDPEKLAIPVVAADYNGEPSVRFRCKTGNCIRAIGRRIVMVDGMKDVVDIDEWHDSNNWVVNTRTRSTALADVMTNLLKNFNFEREECSNDPFDAAAAPAE